MMRSVRVEFNFSIEPYSFRVALVGVESLGRICLRAAEVAREGSTKCGKVDLAAPWLRREPMGVQG